MAGWNGIDAARFIRLCRFHRVQGLVFAAIARSEAPPKIIAAIKADALKIAADNLRAAVESRDLLDDFSRRAIDLIFVKGLTLGILSYGTAGVKAAVDIDLLVSGDDLESAADALQSRGYRIHEPAGPYQAERLRAWHGPGKESTWVRPDPWSVVDLHTQLSDQPRLVPTIGLGSPRQTVEVAPGIGLATLASNELFAYLCVHGASSAWFRLKWIADLAAWLAKREPNELPALYQRSQELGAARAAGQALLLADFLFGSLTGHAELRNQRRADRRSRLLCSAALRQLAPDREPIEPTSRVLGTWRIHWTQFFLSPGLGFKAAELVRQARAALR